MSHLGAIVPMIIAGAVVLTLRLGLPKALRSRHGARRQRKATPLFRLIPVLIPLVMISVAAVAGAFSALDTRWGLALAPVTLVAGLVLGYVTNRTASSLSSGSGAAFWLLIGLLLLRIGVRVTSAGAAPYSPLTTVSADLMLISVGMAGVRLVTLLRARPVSWMLRADPNAHS